MKRTLLLLAFVLLWSQSAFAQPALVQCATKVYTAATTQAISMPSTPSVGNFIIDGGASAGVPAMATASDSDNQATGGNTYQNDKQQLDPDLSIYASQILSAKITKASGTFTITAVGDANTVQWERAPCEFSGLNTTTWLDKTAANTGTVGALSLTVTAGSSNTQAGDLVVGCIGFRSPSTNQEIQTPSGYTEMFVEQDNGSHMAAGCWYKIQSGTGPSSIVFTWTDGTGTSAFGVLATYSPAGGASANTHSLLTLGVGN